MFISFFNGKIDIGICPLIIKSFANVNEGMSLCLSEAPEKNEIRQFL